MSRGAYRADVRAGNYDLGAVRVDSGVRVGPGRFDLDDARGPAYYGYGARGVRDDRQYYGYARDADYNRPVLADDRGFANVVSDSPTPLASKPALRPVVVDADGPSRVGPSFSRDLLDDVRPVGPAAKIPAADIDGPIRAPRARFDIDDRPDRPIAVVGGPLATAPLFNAPVLDIKVPGPKPVTTIEEREKCIGDGCSPLQIAPNHKIENFGIADREFVAPDFQIKDVIKQPDALDDSKRLAENVIRARKNEEELALYRAQAADAKDARIAKGRAIVETAEHELDGLKLTKVDLPVVKVAYKDPVLLQPRVPNLRVPDLPAPHPIARPYIFDEAVCTTLNCKRVKPIAPCPNCHD